MNRIGQFFREMGGKLGIAVSVLGFFLIYLGWNGAASFDDIREQFPYLVSGGLAGLGLVVIGAALLVVESARRERAELQATLLEIRDGLERMGAAGDGVQAAVAAGPGTVVAGSASYHRPDCHLVTGRDGLEILTPGEAEEAGLAPCRVCEPPAATATNGPSRRQLRAH